MNSTEAHECILNVQKRWIEAETAGDADGVVALCCDRVVFQPPAGRALVGRQAVMDFLKASPSTIQSIELSNVRIDASGDLFVKQADFQTRLMDGGVVRGAHLWLLTPDLKVRYVTWITPVQNAPGNAG